jgi:cell shape-determining protein MreD
MTSRARLVAAIAGLLTVLLVQATLVAPVMTPWAVSLPAVLVAAVALVDGPATGMSFGFATGLVADLGSRHPAGVLALCWLGVGLVCGMLADRHSVRRDALIAGVVCALAAAVAILLLTVLHRGGSVGTALSALVPTLVGDALLGLGVVPLVRRMLRSDSLRAPHPVYTELLVGQRHG